MNKDFAIVNGIEKEVTGFHVKTYCDFCGRDVRNATNGSLVTFKATVSSHLSSPVITHNFSPDICYDCADKLMCELRERTK